MPKITTSRAGPIDVRKYRGGRIQPERVTNIAPGARTPGMVARPPSSGIARTPGVVARPPTRTGAPPMQTSVVPTPEGNYLINGPVLEADPQCPGYARLARYSKGSALRNGRSYVALGAVSTAIGIGAAVLITWVIQEPGYLGKLCLQSATDTLGLFVTNLSIRGDSLFSGDVVGEMFRPDSTHSPLFGHYIDTNTRLTIELRNDSAAAMQISPSFALI